MTHRVRHSSPELEFLPIERLGRLRRGLSMESSLLIDGKTINHLRNDQLIEAVNKIE